MSVNASSDSSLHPPLSMNCPHPFFTMSSVTNATNGLVLLLLFALVLLLDCRQRRRASAAAVGDAVVVYHSMAMQLQELAGISLYFFATYTDRTHLFWMATNIAGSGSHGQLLLHVLTCGERYLAVVHAVFFMRLRKTGAVKLRNACLCCVWLLCGVAMVILHFTHSLKFMLFYISFTMLLLTVVLLCSAAVLRALRRPRPGDDADGKARRVDPSKHRAFRTIATILTALVFKLIGTVSCAVLFSDEGKYFISCPSLMALAWLDMPSNMVLPVLYLHRTRRQLQQQQPRK